MSKLIVANWKMQLTHNESIEWLNANSADLETTLANSQNKLVLCPSFTILSHLNSLKPAAISYGAQDCGFATKGAYTGDISAASLKELNCSFCIVGHSERRIYYNETDEMIAQKVLQLINIGIEPIICIGETGEERADGKTELILKQQIDAILVVLNACKSNTVTFAYEPVWAVSSWGKSQEEGLKVDNKIYDEEVNNTILSIRSYLSEHLTNTIYKLLYGGSVSPATFDTIKTMTVDGFLIGKASVESQLLKKIILSC